MGSVKDKGDILKPEEILIGAKPLKRREGFNGENG